MKQRKIAVILAGLLLLAGCGNSIKNEYGTYMGHRKRLPAVQPMRQIPLRMITMQKKMLK